MGPSDETKQEFMNSCGEVHAVWFGICEGANLFSIRALSLGERLSLWQEWHYFLAGIVVCALAQVLALTLGVWVVLGPAAGVAAFGLATLVWAWLIFPRKRDRYRELAAGELEAYAAIMGDTDAREILRQYGILPTGVVIEEEDDG